MQDLNGFVIKENFLVVTEKGLGRPRREWCGRLLSGRRAHLREDVLVSDDTRRRRREARVARSVAAQPLAGLGDEFVATDVVGMYVSVDQDANRLVGNLPNSRDDLIAEPARPGIDEQDSLVADLDCDVPTSSDQHVDV